MATSLIKPVNQESTDKNPTVVSLGSFGPLPNELISHIASFLNPKDQQSLAFTNKTLNKCVALSARESELAGLRKFLKNLLDRLQSPANDGLKGRLNDILSDILPKMELETLILIKSHLIEKKRLIIQVLQELDSAVLNQLNSDLATPYFLENIFKLASLEKEFQAASLEVNSPLKSLALSRISRDIAVAGDIDRALEIELNNIHTQSMEVEWLRPTIYMDLTNCGQFNGAIKFARAIALRGGFPPMILIKDIAVRAARSGHVDKALELLREFHAAALKERPL